MAMSRTALLLALFAGIVMSDGAAQSGYGAPQSGYGAPSGGSAYAAPQEAYEYPDYGTYAPAQEDGGLDIGAKLEELLPLFIAVFAAIILAQLLAPLLLQLLTLVVGILPMALSIKAPIINALLAPFSLQLCNTDGTAFPRSFSSESFRSFLPEGISEDKLNIMTKFASEALERFTSMNENNEA
eukprot:TRINITY_DN2145_c0_g1_i1.p1 TRINITY_DN2145_c0_g1~~TRINITY_DN2145_c0_g1_i1.p1  ORF type:complete len:184 (-),score=39.13 TRINITY_DN2145_c0_g1_i1:975-1526(-)